MPRDSESYYRGHADGRRQAYNDVVWVMVLIVLVGALALALTAYLQ